MSFKLRLQLGFTCGTAADSYNLYFQILSVYQRSFEVFLFFSFFFFFFFWLFCFYFRKRKSSKIYEKYPFIVFSGATDRNFTSKSRRRLPITFVNFVSHASSQALRPITFTQLFRTTRHQFSPKNKRKLFSDGKSTGVLLSRAALMHFIRNWHSFPYFLVITKRFNAS